MDAQQARAKIEKDQDVLDMALWLLRDREQLLECIHQHARQAEKAVKSNEWAEVRRRLALLEYIA